MPRKILLGREPNAAGWEYVGEASAHEDMATPHEIARKKAVAEPDTTEHRSEVERIEDDICSIYEEYRVITVAQKPSGELLDNHYTF